MDTGLACVLTFSYYFDMTKSRTDEKTLYNKGAAMPTFEQIDGISPEMINLSDGLADTFGRVEYEEIAEQLIRFAQHQGNWNNFRRSELRMFLSDDEFYLDQAEQLGFVANNDDGTYSYEIRLVVEAHEKHPA
jgi:hypothetical protein